MAAKIRFPRKLECYVSEAMADGLELLASDQLLTVSDHMRIALVSYLRQAGIMSTRRPAQNGGARADHASFQSLPE